MIVRPSVLAPILDRLEGFSKPLAAAEQVRTPAAAAVEMLTEATNRDDIAGRSVVDLGSGTGILAIGAALLGARVVLGIERDPDALASARENATRAGVGVRWLSSDVADFRDSVDTVLMNPPFGSQHQHADRPFWTTGLRSAQRSVYAFSLRDSRKFIERLAVARGARIELCRPVRWVLPPTFPHHRERGRPIPVDLWVLRTTHDSSSQR